MSELQHPLANIQVPATNGMMDAYIAKPEGNPKSIVLMQVELRGLSQHMVEVANRLAAAGYVAIACDLFRGATPPLPTDPVENWGQAFQAFDDVSCTLDCRHALEWLLSDESGFDDLNVYAWGFSKGGRFAHYLGAFDPRLAGIINFYGRINFPRMETKPFLPIEITRMIERPYLGVFAETDDLIPDADIERLQADLTNNPAVDVSKYPGTQHAFFNDHRDAYHPEAAGKAWQAVLAFLDKHG